MPVKFIKVRELSSQSPSFNFKIEKLCEKFHNIRSDGIVEWLAEDKPSVLLISNANLVSPLLKSIAIDFLDRVNVGMISNLMMSRINLLLAIRKLKFQLPPNRACSILIRKRRVGGL